jgi:hypothetical protein
MKRFALTIPFLILLATACNSGQPGPAAETVTANATPTGTALEPVEPAATTTPTAEPAATALSPAPTEAPTMVPESITPSSDPLIIFKRSGGFAGLEDQWIIYPDGRVEGGGATQEAIPADQIAQILADAEAGGFFNLKDQYIDVGHCCDFFNYEITISLPDGRSHTVATAEQTPGMPPVLAQLIQELNDLLVSGGGIQE